MNNLRMLALPRVAPEMRQSPPLGRASIGD